VLPLAGTIAAPRSLMECSLPESSAAATPPSTYGAIAVRFTSPHSSVSCSWPHLVCEGKGVCLKLQLAHCHHLHTVASHGLQQQQRCAA
jgi:hypothetical protein